MATESALACTVCKKGFTFKSKYDKHLKTREHLFNIDSDHAPGAVDTQCTSSVLRSHSDYESTIAGPSKLCIDAGFEQLNEAASTDENDEMDPDEGILRHWHRWLSSSFQSPFLAPAEIEVWLALSKVFKFAYCDRVNPESMGYYETIVQNFVATTVVHSIFLLYGGSPKSTCFFIFLKICECLESIRFAFAGSSYSPSERCGDDLIALYHSMGVQRYLGGTSVQHDKPIHQPELGSIVLNAPDLGNTTSLYDLKDFTLLLPPGITLSTIGHFAKAIVGVDGKVINLCDHVVYIVEAIFSKL
eukprot:Em0001g1443a